MGIESRTGVAGPQAPHVPRRQAVPVVAVPVLDALDRQRLLVPGQLDEASPVRGNSIGVQEGQCEPPSLTVGGHVRVVPAVGAALDQPLVDHREHRHLRLVPLVEQVVEQRGRGRLLGRREEPQRLRRSEPAQHHAGGDLVPGGQLGEDVVAGEPALLTGRGAGAAPHQRSRRSTAASSPIPPTMVTSSGANRGGPISAL